MRQIFFIIIFGLLVGCGAKDSIEDAIDSVNPDRHPIDTSITGVNAFANDARFGSISAQLNEVTNTLGLNHIRVLFAWNDAVQPAAASSADFSFYDEIIAAVPAGTDVLIVVTGVPSWMHDSTNYIEGNARKTFAELWVRPVVERYGTNSKVSAIEIWNEPNMLENGDNAVIGVSESPSNYVELLGFSYSIVKDLAPRLLVVSAATTAINQNFPATKSYNQDMQSAGAESFADIWGVHYYGKQFENVVRNNGVQDFLNTISRPIWVTESGAQGVNQQLPYVETTWPFLTDKIPGIQRFYYYQFTEATSPEIAYGLKNLSADTALSDLYVFLRDR